MRIFLALEINGGPEIGPGLNCSKARKGPRGAEAREKDPGPKFWEARRPGARKPGMLHTPSAHPEK